MCIDVTEAGQQQMCGENTETIERVLQFGRELQQDSEQLKRDPVSCESIKRSLQVGASRWCQGADVLSRTPVTGCEASITVYSVYSAFGIINKIPTCT